jgi:hypothetical protein
MVATIPTSPYQTTVGSGLFTTTAVGLVQGTAYPDPATRYALRGGVLAGSETLPMWGGVGVFANVPNLVTAPGPSATMGPQVGRATALTGSAALAGFSVFDQDYAMVNSPASPVPLIDSYHQVMWYRLGSGARIAVACSPSLVNLRGEPIGTQVSWDFTNQQLEPYSSGTISTGTYTSAATISSGAYVSSTGAVSLTMNANHGLIAGDTFTLSGVTGTGSFATLDGTFVATTGTTGTTLNFTVAAGLTMTITGGNIGTAAVSMTTTAPHGLNPGDTFELSSMTGTNAATYLNGEQTAAAGTTASTIRVLLASGLTLTVTGGTLASGGALACSVLDVQIGNCMTVTYNAAANTAQWNFNGNCAVIQI